MVILAVINSKGGVGKTTTAVNLAAALAAPRLRVLLVDLDSQASASVWCGIDRRHLRPSSASCLLEKYPILEAIRQSDTAHLDVLPGSLELASVTEDLSSRVRTEFRDTVFNTEIRWTRALAGAPAARQSVFRFAPRSASVAAFRGLAAEVLHRLPSIHN